MIAVGCSVYQTLQEDWGQCLFNLSWYKSLVYYSSGNRKAVKCLEYSRNSSKSKLIGEQCRRVFKSFFYVIRATPFYCLLSYNIFQMCALCTLQNHPVCNFVSSRIVPTLSWLLSIFNYMNHVRSYKGHMKRTPLPGCASSRALSHKLLSQ